MACREPEAELSGSWWSRLESNQHQCLRRALLYPLSYGTVVIAAGVEPATSSSASLRSIQLSYATSPQQISQKSRGLI